MNYEKEIILVVQGENDSKLNGWYGEKKCVDFYGAILERKVKKVNLWRRQDIGAALCLGSE